jgi:hypothetical protein
MFTVPLPVAGDLLTFMGWSPDAVVTAQATAHLNTAALAARTYTRGRGFVKDADNSWTLEEDIAAVIVSAAARSLNNPTQDKRIEAGSFNSVPGSFAGWSLAELGILHAYRRRAG